MHWTIDELEALTVDQYAVLVEWLGEQFEARVRPPE
jgi:NDP-sugar pyrophosphorylase family protein